MRRALAVLFAVYLALLVWLVLWKLHVPFIGRDDMRELKLIPFVSGGSFGASAPFELIGNLLVFVPFGVYVGLLAPAWRWTRVLAVAAGASLTLEVVQFVTAVGSADVTDVIVNSAGGLLGFGLLALAHRRRVVDRVFVSILAACTVLALVAAGVQVASFPRIPPPRQGEPTIVSPPWSPGPAAAPL